MSSATKASTRVQQFIPSTEFCSQCVFTAFLSAPVSSWNENAMQRALGELARSPQQDPARAGQRTVGEA